MDIIGILGVVIAILTFGLQFFSRPKEEFNHLKIQFKATQKLSLQVQSELEQYIIKYDAENKYMFPGMTYKACLAEMRRSFKENLSDEIFNKIESLKLSKTNINSMNESLKTQYSALSQIHSQLRIMLDS